MRIENCTPKTGEVIRCYLNNDNDDVIIGYVVGWVENSFIIYIQNRLMAMTVQHTYEDDPNTGEHHDEYEIVTQHMLCDCVIIPEADMIMKTNY